MKKTLFLLLTFTLFVTFNISSENNPTIVSNSGGCGGNTDYCDLLEPFSFFSWISNVNFNTIDNSSENDEGYADFTGVSTTLELGNTYTLSISRDIEFEAEHIFYAWIDFNQDGDFDDAGEEILNSGNTPINDLFYADDVYVLPNSLIGFTRMRVMISGFTEAGPCQEFLTGEVEDYCIEILEGTGCYQAYNIALNDISETSATINWEDESGLNYDLRIRELGAMDWVAYNGLTENELVLTDLLPCTDYEFQIRTNCDNQNSSYTFITSFITLGCGACTDFVYCETGGDVTDFEFINQVTIKDLDNISGDDGGYGDYTGMFIPDLRPDSTYDIFIDPFYPYGEFSVTYSVFIDFNQDGQFDPGTELAYVSMPVEGPITGTVTIPADAPLGVTRMRVIMEEYQDSEPCGTFTYGEAEDYCINILPAIFPCLTPENITLMGTTENTATLSWDVDLWELSIGYVLRYREMGNMDWNELSDNNEEILITNLSGCTDYEFQIRTLCPTALSEFSEIFPFTTDCTSSTTIQEQDIQAFQVYPNPFSAQISLAYRLKENTDVTLSLLHINGQILHQETLRGQAAGEHLVVWNNQTHLPKGIYLVSIQTEQSNFVTRVLKQD